MKTIIVVAMVIVICVILALYAKDKRGKNTRDMTIAHNAEIHAAYEMLVYVRDRKKKTKAELEAAITGAISWLEQALE